MGTTVADLRRWFNEGKAKKATHMIVVCDTFDYEDYPTYVKEGENVLEKVAFYRKQEMSKVMEVYSYKKTWEEQGATAGRVWNVD